MNRLSRSVCVPPTRMNKAAHTASMSGSVKWFMCARVCDYGRLGWIENPQAHIPYACTYTMNGGACTKYTHRHWCSSVIRCGPALALLLYVNSFCGGIVSIRPPRLWPPASYSRHSSRPFFVCALCRLSARLGTRCICAKLNIVISFQIRFPRKGDH